MKNMSESAQSESFILILGRDVLGVTYAMMELECWTHESRPAMPAVVIIKSRNAKQ